MYSQVRIVIPRFEDFEDPPPPLRKSRVPFPSPLHPPSACNNARCHCCCLWYYRWRYVRLITRYLATKQSKCCWEINEWRTVVTVVSYVHIMYILFSFLSFSFDISFFFLSWAKRWSLSPSFLSRQKEEFISNETGIEFWDGLRKKDDITINVFKVRRASWAAYIQGQDEIEVEGKSWQIGRVLGNILLLSSIKKNPVKPST